MTLNLPNKLTLFRVVLIPVFLIILLGGLFAEDVSRYAACAVFLAASFTDFLDGYLARKHNLVTNFGKFMDPLADKLLVCSALIALQDLGQLPSYVVIVIISRELIITGFRAIAAEKNLVLAAGMSGKIKTFVQMIMIIVLLLGFEGTVWEAIGFLLIAASLFFTVYSACEYIWKNFDVLKD